jgi:hypothetical protein
MTTGARLAAAGLEARLLWAVGALAAGAAAPAAAAVWSVAPGQNLAQVVQRAADGDVIELAAGTHRAQVAVLEQRRVTLRGAPGGPRPVLLAAGQHAEGKGILVIRGGEVRVESLEFRGARVPDRNGAGIRFERGRLWVRDCVFIDNENGILTNNDGESELTVQDSEFGQAPDATPLPHLIYVGRIARFVLQGSHLWGGQWGHLVKSRARSSDVRYNHLVDGTQGRAAYELEFPNGGLATVVGNVVAQSGHSSNRTLVSFGAEGEVPGTPREHRLVLINNTLVNSGWQPAYFVRVHGSLLQSGVQQRWVNNLFVGVGVANLAWNDWAHANFWVPPAVLKAGPENRFALRDRVWFSTWGLAPDALQAPADAALRALWPQAEFTPPLGSRPLPTLKRWAPGAHQPVPRTAPASAAAAPPVVAVHAPFALFDPPALETHHTGQPHA